jgi:hypothetical protein
MPLVSCQQCGKQVSDTAELCPHCGHQQPQYHISRGGIGTKCGVCGTLNQTGYWDDSNCRHCGKSLEASNPHEWIISHSEAIHRNAEEVGWLLGIVGGVIGGVIAFFCWWLYNTLENRVRNLIVIAAAACIGYWMVKSIVGAIIRANCYLSWFSDPSKYKNQIRRGYTYSEITHGSPSGRKF